MDFFQELIQRIEQKKTMDAHDYNARGNCYLYLKDYRSALRDLTLATQMEPTILYYWTDRASLFMRLRQYERAITDCRLAISFQKLDYLKQGQYKRALFFYPFSTAVAIIAQARTLLGYNLLPPPRQEVQEQCTSTDQIDVDALLLTVFGTQEQRVLVMV